MANQAQILPPLQLRDVSLSPVVSEHCIVAIAEINLLYVVAPVDIFSVIATKLHIDVGDGVADCMDKCLQNQAWIAEFDRLVSLIDVVQVTLIGTCRHANEFNLNIPLLEHSQIQPYLRPVITHILEDMLAEVHINPAVFGDALESCVTRFLNHPDEIRLFHHIQSMAIEQHEIQLGEPLVHGENMVPVPAQVMVSVLDNVEEKKAIHQRKARSSQVLDLVILKFANEDKLEATATEIMEEYNNICAAKEMAAKNLHQVKAMCGRLGSNGGIIWKNNAITIPPNSYILDLKAIAVAEAELEVLEP
ncbi:hypothetical protein ACLB2K_036536 [Fragaria x ananassa]